MQVLLAVKDAKAGAFVFPHFSASKGEAIRSFGDGVLNEQTPLHAHPEDFALYVIADWDPREGKLVPKASPEFVANAVDFVKLKEV